jgi:glycosyltransferase involved in cell wall biosynthesis
MKETPLDYRKLNVAFISDYSYPYTKGGVETRYYTLAHYLIDQGHQVTWFTSQQWRGKREQEFEGIKLVGICPACRTFDKTGKRSKKEALLFGLAAFKLLFMPGRFDVFDVSQYPFFHAFPVKLYSVFRRVPVVMSWYEFWGDHWLEYAGQGFTAIMGKWIEKAAIFTIPDIIPDSEQARDFLIAAGCDPRRIHYIPLAVDLKRIYQIEPADDPCDIVYFGRLKDHKNIDKLICAIALCQTNGLTLKTKICGDGPERQRLQELAEELGLTKSVKFLGRVDRYDDLMAHVKTGRLFVHPSTKEGGGSTTVIEANGCGLPVIVVKHPLGFDRCLVEDGVNGFWADSEEPAELARIIQAYFSLSEKGKERMSTSSKVWAQQFDFHAVYPHIEKVYQQLAASNDTYT